MRADEIREMTEADIKRRVGELEEERFRLKFRAGSQALEDPLRLRTVRKDIARLKTILRARELEAAVAAGTGRPRLRGTRAERAEQRAREHQVNERRATDARPPAR